MSDILRDAAHIAAAEWTLHDVIADLRHELAEEHEITGIIAKERDRYRKALAGAEMRLAHSEERAEWLRKRLSRTDLWAAFWLLVWRMQR